MKHKAWIPYLISALFAFVLAVSSIGNLITGYELPVDAMWKIYLWCAFVATSVAVSFQHPHSGKNIIGLAGSLAFALALAELFRPQMQKQIETLCYCISSHYHDVYNWPILGAQSADDVSVPLILWAVLVAFSVNWYICRRKHIVVAIIPAVAPLVLCLVTADKVPHGVYLYLLILGLATLLVTDWTRRKQPAQGTKLVLRLVSPIAIFLALLFICNPKANYVNHAGIIQKELSVWFEKVQDAAESVMTGTPIGSSAGKKQNLQAAGERSKSSRSVMIVKSPIDGTLYLRERDYDVYTGTVWEASSERKEKFTSGTTSVGKLTILTYSTRSTLFVPYYATTGIQLVDGALENEMALQQYSYGLSPKQSLKTSLPGVQYKALPVETQAWATELVSKITEEAKTRQRKILAIQDYVRSSAIYDTSTPRMDSSHRDFARWFLEESETGYCIHYATAATVLLRAAGIHARYVEGYIVNCKAGEDVVVSQQDAHAWVEYYDLTTRAWCILEPTPAYPETMKPVTAPGKPQGGGTTSGNSGDGPVGDTPVEDTPAEDIPAEDPTVEDMPTEDVPMDPTANPEETESPEDPVEDTTSQNQGPAPRKMPKWIKIALGCLLLVFCILLQGYVRIYRKRKLWNRGASNTRAIWRWRQTRSLAKLLKQSYPEELDALAQKARFSQHKIQRYELRKYEDYRLTLMALIAKKPWYQRMVFKWILAID